MSYLDIQRKRKNCIPVLTEVNKLEFVSSFVCNICDSSEIVVLSDLDRYGLKIRSGLCKNCGLVFLIDRLTKSGYWEFYSTGLYRKLVSAYNEKEVTNEGIYNMQKYFARNLIYVFDESFADHKDGRMLDIGGSSGNIAKVLREKYNFDLTILDPAESELNYKSSHNIKLIHSFIEDLNLTEIKYDVILLYQTIDHLFDLRKSLRNINKLLDENGIFIFDILDFSLCCNYGPPDNFLKIDHCFYLSREIIETTMASFGFSVSIVDINTNPFHTTFLCKKVSPSIFSNNHNNLFCDDLISKIRKWQYDSPSYNFKDKLKVGLYKFKKMLISKAE